MKTCASCPTPAKCRSAGKCLNPKKSSKKMGKTDPKHRMNTERTTSNPSGKYNT